MADLGKDVLEKLGKIEGMLTLMAEESRTIMSALSNRLDALQEESRTSISVLNNRLERLETSQDQMQDDITAVLAEIIQRLAALDEKVSKNESDLHFLEEGYQPNGLRCSAIKIS